MKIALIGYGNMGKEIEELVAERNEHMIVSVSLRDRSSGVDSDGIKKADVVIDFTSPEIVVSTIEHVAALGTPLVMGTTGWYDKLPTVEKIVKQTQIGFLYGQNFSVGANIFFELTAYAGRMFHNFDGYDVFGIETHHRGKKDSPSGTARKLAEILLKEYSRKRSVQTETLQRKISEEELHFASVRGGRNFGRHEIVFDSPADEIRLTHQAWGRRGFAEGAILAAEFIKGKKGFYNFSDVFRHYFLGREVEE